MNKIDKMWNDIESTNDNIPAINIDSYPHLVKQYFQHSINNPVRKIKAVRLFMNGQIKLNKWLDFSAEQIIEIDHGYLWQANVSMRCVFISGYDLLYNNTAKMRWNLYGFLPIINVSDLDLRKSAIGRYAIETLWIPTHFLNNISWRVNNNIVKANYNALNEDIELNFKIDNDGRMKEVFMNRWGNIESKKYRKIPFGAYIEDEKCFDGLTIPSKLRAGWFFGTSDFEDKGEFFRVEITRAEYK
jgi:hypothetical protein